MDDKLVGVDEEKVSVDENLLGVDDKMLTLSVITTRVYTTPMIWENRYTKYDI